MKQLAPSSYLVNSPLPYLLSTYCLGVFSNLLLLLLFVILLLFPISLLLFALFLVPVLLVVLVLVLVLLLLLPVLILPVLLIILIRLRILKDVPLDDWPTWVLQSLFPVLESWLVGFVLGPTQRYLSNWVSSTNQIVVAHRDIKGHFLHVHLVNDENEGFVPVWVEVAALHARLLLLTNSLLLCIKELKLDIRVRRTSDVHLLQLTRLQHSHCEFSRRGDISEGDAEVAEVLVGPIVHWSQVLPLLNWPSKVNLVERQLELAGLIRRRKSVVIVDCKHKSLVKGVHIRKVLEDEGLVEFWVEVLPVDFCLVLWLLVRE